QGVRADEAGELVPLRAESLPQAHARRVEEADQRAEARAEAVAAFAVADELTAGLQRRVRILPRDVRPRRPLRQHPGLKLAEVVAHLLGDLADVLFDAG